MPSVTVVRTYLEHRSRSVSGATPASFPGVGVVRIEKPDTALFRQLYRDVGGAYHWRDRNALADDTLRAHFESPDVQLWVLFDGSSPAGFFELQRHGDGSVEIVYFGIAAAVFGRGLGKYLLTNAVEQAWEFGANRVWLHTCTLDAPSALPNYLARGFEPFRTETYETTIPEPANAGA